MELPDQAAYGRQLAKRRRLSASEEEATLASKNDGKEGLQEPAGATARHLLPAEEPGHYTPEHTEGRREFRRHPVVLPGGGRKAASYGLIAVGGGDSLRASRRTRSSASIETSAEEKETYTSPELGPGASWSVSTVKGSKGRSDEEGRAGKRAGACAARDSAAGSRTLAQAHRGADEERMPPHSPARDGSHQVCWDSDALPSPYDLGLSEADDEEVSPQKEALAEKNGLVLFAEQSLQGVGLATLTVPSGATSSKGAFSAGSPFLPGSGTTASPRSPVPRGDKSLGDGSVGSDDVSAKASPHAHHNVTAGADASQSSEDAFFPAAPPGGVPGTLTVEELLTMPERRQDPEAEKAAKTDFDCLAALIQDALGEAGGAAGRVAPKRRCRTLGTGFNPTHSARPGSGSVAGLEAPGALGRELDALVAGGSPEESRADLESDGQAAGGSWQESLHLQYDTRNGGTYEEDLDSASLSFLLGHPEGSEKGPALSASAGASTAASVSSFFPSEAACGVYAPGQHGRPTQSQDPAKERQRRLARDRETLNLSAQIAARFKSCRTEDVMRLFRRYLAVSSRQVRDPATLERVVAACCYISSRQAMDGLSLSDICHEMDASNGQDLFAAGCEARGKKLADGEGMGRGESDRERAGGAHASMRCKSLGKWVVRICRKLQLQALPDKDDDPEERANRVLARVKQLLIAKMEEEEQRRPQLVNAFVRATQSAVEKQRLKAEGDRSEADSLASLESLLGDEARRADARADAEARRQTPAEAQLGDFLDGHQGGEKTGRVSSARINGRAAEASPAPPAPQDSTAPADSTPAAGSEERQALNAIEELLAQVTGGSNLDCFGSATLAAVDSDLASGTSHVDRESCARLRRLDKSGRDAFAADADGPERPTENEVEPEARPGAAGVLAEDVDEASMALTPNPDDRSSSASGDAADPAASIRLEQREEKNGDASGLSLDICPSLFDPVDMPALSASAEGDSGDSSPFSPILTSLLSASLPPSETLAQAKDMQPAARLQLQRFTWLQKMRAEALEKLKKEKEAVFRGLVLLQRILQLFYDVKQGESDGEREDGEDGEGKKRQKGWTEEDPLDKRWRARGRCDAVSLASLIIIVFKWMQIPIPQRIALDALHVDRKSVYKRRLEQMHILKTLFGHLRGMVEKKDGSSSSALAEELKASLPPHLASLLQQVVGNPATMQRLLALADEEEELGNFISSQSLGSDGESGKASAGLGGVPPPAAAASPTPVKASQASFHPQAPAASSPESSAPSVAVEPEQDAASSSFLAAILAEVAAEREVGAVKTRGPGDAERTAAELGFQTRKKRRVSELNAQRSPDNGLGSDLYDEDREASSAVPVASPLANLCSSLSSSSHRNPSEMAAVASVAPSPRAARHPRAPDEVTLQGLAVGKDAGTPRQAGGYAGAFLPGDGDRVSEGEDGRSERVRARFLAERGSMDASSSFALGFSLAEALLRHGFCLPSPSDPPAGLADAQFATGDLLRDGGSPSGERALRMQPEGFSATRGSRPAVAPGPAGFGIQAEAEHEGRGDVNSTDVIFSNRATRDIIASFLASASTEGHPGTASLTGRGLEDGRSPRLRGPLAAVPKAVSQADRGPGRFNRGASGSCRQPSSRSPPLPVSPYRVRTGDSSRQRPLSPSSLFAAAASMAGVLPGPLPSSRSAGSSALSPGVERSPRERGAAQALEATRRCDVDDRSLHPSSSVSAVRSLLPAEPALGGASPFASSALAMGLPEAGASQAGADAPLASPSIALATVAHLKAAEKALLDSVPDSARVVSLQFERTQQRWVCKWQRHKPAGAPANRKEPWHRRCFSVIKYGYEGAHALAAAVAKKLRDGRRALLQKQRRLEEEGLAEAEEAPRDEEEVGDAEDEEPLGAAEEAEETVSPRVDAGGDRSASGSAEAGKQ
ncbi:AP2 domain transcription factor AP2X-3 [Toxoplasma gondii p89]|uniref:AP2 domain transcription factor AP2X-3 n=1 Tax=Toxoplasma gondii p89 TaxID=943119 RepID=A0A086K9Q5_TOXGO|nr:AP2 domain transcription factor AP2X-3 [Toxoplasma gondii p89]